MKWQKDEYASIPASAVPVVTFFYFGGKVFAGQKQKLECQYPQKIPTLGKQDCRFSERRKTGVPPVGQLGKDFADGESLPRPDFQPAPRLVTHFDFGAFALADPAEKISKPGEVDIEGLSAFDAWKFNRT